MRILGALYASCGVCAVWATTLGAQTTAADRARFERRAIALARLDATVHYFHPKAATGDGAWDAGFAAAAEGILYAGDERVYASAVRRLVDGIRDPQTRVVASVPTAWRTRWAGDSVLLIDVAPGPVNRTTPEMLRGLKGIVVDCRGAGQCELPLESVGGSSSREMSGPSQKRLEYEGFPSGVMATSGGYRRHWILVSPERTPVSELALSRGIVFVADERSVLSGAAAALQSLGRAKIVGVRIPRVGVGSRTSRIPMGEGVTVEVRTGVPLSDSASVPVDTVVDADSDAGSVALRLAREPFDTNSISIAGAVEATKVDSFEEVPVRPPRAAGWSARYPSPGYRVLAAARLWSTIKLFYPYWPLIRDNWDSAYVAAVVAVERAQDSTEFGKAIRQLAWHVHDSHTKLRGDPLGLTLAGSRPAPIAVRFIEGRLIVTRIRDGGAGSGVEVGDEVTAIDDEPVAARASRLGAYVIASTPQSRRSQLADLMLSDGGAPRPMHLIVKKATGLQRQLVIERPPLDPSLVRFQRTGEIIRMMPNGIGYVDLDRLAPEMVDSMLKSMSEMRGIIFDMRGYPQGTAWLIAPWLNQHAGLTTAALFRRLIVSGPDSADRRVFEFRQPIPVARTLARYTGRTVMLVDERTLSQAEHTALFFEAANGTTFVGSPTAGANGDVTGVLLPGSLFLTFTGHDVRHADGRQLQRVGIIPQLVVEPTIAGVREGKDEILDAALRELTEALAAGASGDSVERRSRPIHASPAAQGSSSGRDPVKVTKPHRDPEQR